MKLTVSSVTAIIVVGIMTGVAPAAHATLDPCKTAKEFNSEGGNMGDFVMDDGYIVVVPCPDPQPQESQPAKQPVTEPAETIQPQKAQTEVDQVNVENTEPKPAPEVTQPAAPKREKEKKEKAPKKDKEVVVPDEPNIEFPAIDSSVEVQDNDEVVIGIVEDVPVAPEAVGQLAKYPTDVVYVESNNTPLYIGGIALAIAAIVLFVASRRHRCTTS